MAPPIEKKQKIMPPLICFGKIMAPTMEASAPLQYKLINERSLKQLINLNELIVGNFIQMIKARKTPKSLNISLTG